MREQAYTEVAVVLIYDVGFSNCVGFVVMEPRGRTRADEVACLPQCYSTSMLLFSAVAKMKIGGAHFESLLSTVVPLRKVSRRARPRLVRLPCAMRISKHVLHQSQL